MYTIVTAAAPYQRGGLMAFFAVTLAMGLGLMARPAAAAPFAYVVNQNDDTVSVLDTASKTVVATIPVGGSPEGVAVTPDAKHVYVANFFPSNTVSVIDTATNTVGATIPVGVVPFGVAITPDGKHVYVTHNASTGTVSVIDTATNTVEATPIPVGSFPDAVAVTPDGKHVYVGNSGELGVGCNVGSTVSVIATATNTVVATIPVPTPDFGPGWIAITPGNTPTPRMMTNLFR
jgi:YVTN family beta-propeller protein